MMLCLQDLTQKKISSVSVFCWCFLIIFFIYNSAFSQQEEAFTVKRYSSSNGLPQNTIRSMVMDDSRFLWMTTEEGLVRFDGRNFRVYNQNNQPEINNDRFRWFMKTIDGKLVVSELTGATFIISKGEITLVKKGDVQKSTEQFIRGTAPNLDYYLEGLNRKFPGVDASELSDFSVFLAELPNFSYGVFLKQTSSFKIFKGNRNVKNIKFGSKKPAHLFTIGKSVYFFDSNKILYYIDIEKGTIKETTLKGDLSNKDLKYFLIEKNVISSSGYPDVYIKLKNNLFRFYPTGNPLVVNSVLITKQLPTNCNISDAFFDTKSQSLYLGTDTKGLYIYKKNNLKTIIYSDKFGNQNNAYYSQVDIDSNTIFTWYKKEFRLDGAKRSNLPIPSHSPECLIKDSSNRIFYAIADTMVCYDLVQNTTLKTVCDNVQEFYSLELSGDSILVGTLKGIGYFKNNKYHHIYHQSDKAPDSRIEFLKIGPDGKIWVARCKGIALLDLKTGMLEEAKGLSNICARVLFRDKDKMFIGTYGNGYFVWENGKVTKMPLDKNQNLSHVHSFMIDRNNFMWMSTNKGLFRTNYENILQYDPKKNQKIYYEYFGQDDGILNTEFNGGCTPPYLRLKNNYVSYPTMEGLVWFIPELIPEDTPDELIIFDQLIVDGKALPASNPLDVPSNHENVEIHFSTPYWGNNSNLNMEYKLEGFNKEWIPVNPDQKFQSFSNLSSGNYTFKLRKQQNSLKQPYLEAAMVFDVDKMYYESPWFILLIMIATAGLFYLLILLNSRRILRKNIELEQRIAERTIELKNVNMQLEENFSQLAQKERFLSESIDVKNRLISIISHDIITPLKFISMVSRISKRNPAVIDKKKLVDSMNDIEFASDKLYNNASNILNWMKFQNNRITPKKDYIALHEFIDDILEPLLGMAETKGIQIQNLVPEEEIMISDRNILMIVLQNLLSNAIKYTEKGTITFSVATRDDMYLITVEDNGIGMSPEVKNTIEKIISRKGQITGETPNHENGNQLGYYIIVDFLQLLKGSIQVTSAPGIGTSVTVSFTDAQ